MTADSLKIRPVPADGKAPPDLSDKNLANLDLPRWISGRQPVGLCLERRESSLTRASITPT